MTFRSLSTIDTLVIHCSASPNSADFSAHEIDAWHKSRGFMRDKAFINKGYPLKHIGYHYVIRRSGLVEVGRQLNEVGAHCRGHNTDSIGICLVGVDRYTAEQWKSLEQLTRHLQNKLVPSIRYIVGHRDLSPDRNRDGVITPNEWLKKCPGFDVGEWLLGNMRPLPEHTSQPKASVDPLPNPHIRRSWPVGYLDTPIDQPVTTEVDPLPNPPQHFAPVDLGMIDNLDAPIDQPETTESTRAAPMADQTIHWLESRTVKSAMVAMAPALLNLFGLNADALMPYLNEFITILGALAAIIYRISATNGIKK